jgi:hypothetical protein
VKRRLYITEKLRLRKARREAAQAAARDPLLLRSPRLGEPRWQRYVATHPAISPAKAWVDSVCAPLYWRSVAQQTEEYFEPDGCDGVDMLREPHARAIAELFTRCLENSEIKVLHGHADNDPAEHHKREGQIAVIPTSRGASVVQLLQAQEASLSAQQATPIIELYLHSRKQVAGAQAEVRSLCVNRPGSSTLANSRRHERSLPPQAPPRAAALMITTSPSCRVWQG